MRIEDLVLIAGFVVGITLILWYLLGSSPTLEQVILGVLFINLGWTYSISSKMNRHLGHHEGYQKAKEERNNSP